VVGQVLDGMLTVQERPEDPQARLVGEQFEEPDPRLELLIGWYWASMRIHAYIVSK
jgi:hypothetical protein